MTQPCADEPASDLLLLSRIGARGESGATRITARRARPSGCGVRIDALCDGMALAFWVAEADWCAWLAPQWPIPSLAALDQALWPLAAGWTLTPVTALLSAEGLAPCRAARLAPAPAPDACLWCLLCESEELRLPLYLQAVPSAWLAGILSALNPDRAATVSLPLALGWCAAPTAAQSLGDALPVWGVDDALERFWLLPAHSPGRVRIIGPDRAEIAEPALREAAWGACSVEVAEARLARAALWPWQRGTAIDMPTVVYPLARLVASGRPLALGSLLRLTDGWAVRLEQWCTDERLPEPDGPG
jgi:type III secretion protein Q